MAKSAHGCWQRKKHPSCISRARDKKISAGAAAGAPVSQKNTEIHKKRWGMPMPGWQTQEAKRFILGNILEVTELEKQNRGTH